MIRIAILDDYQNVALAMADDVAAFVGALDLSQVEVLGFSIGGYTAINKPFACRFGTSRAKSDRLV